MHIVFFNRSFYPDISATGQLLAELCEDLVKDYNCDVMVITSMPLTVEHTYNPNNLCNSGISIFKRDDFKKINILRVRGTTFSPKYFLGRIFNYLTYFLLSFIASFKLKKPDLVVTLTDPPIISLIGLWVSFRFNIPLIISVRDIFPEAARGLEVAQNKIINFFLDCINRFCLKSASHIVTLGKLMHRIIKEKGINQDKVSVIPDWADSSKIFPVSKENTFSLTHNLADSFVIMYSGNLGASSGLETVIGSARSLKDYKDIVFVFIGEGIIKDKLIEFVKGYSLENVKFLPYQSKDMLSYSFSSADVFVIPLKKALTGYSVPSKIYGILASGRPYIACMDEESEIAEITKEFECGLLAKPEDPIDLTKKIILLYDNKELRQKMGENARKAAGLFDRKIGTKSYYELFKRILNDKKGF